MSYHSEFTSFLQQDSNESAKKQNRGGKSRQKGNDNKRKRSPTHTVRSSKRSNQIVKDVDMETKDTPRRLSGRIRGSNHTTNVPNKTPQVTSNSDDENQTLSMSATSSGCKNVMNMASCKPCSVVLDHLPEKNVTNLGSMSRKTPHLRSRMSDRLSRILEVDCHAEKSVIEKSYDSTSEDQYSIAKRTASRKGVVEPESHSTSIDSRKETATSELSLHDQDSPDLILDNGKSEKMKDADGDSGSFVSHLSKSQPSRRLINRETAAKKNETSRQQLSDCKDEGIEDKGLAGNMVYLKGFSQSESTTTSTSSSDGKTEQQDFSSKELSPKLNNLQSETSQLRSLRLTRKKKASDHEDPEVLQIYPTRQRLQSKVFDETKDDRITCDSSKNKVSQPTRSPAYLTEKMATDEDSDSSQEDPLCLEPQTKALDDLREVEIEYVGSINKKSPPKMPRLSSRKRITADDVQLIRTRLTLKKRMSTNKDSKLSEKDSPTEKQQTVVAHSNKDCETKSDTSKNNIPNLKDLRLSLKKKIVIFENPEVTQLQSENDESRTEVCNDNTDGESTSKSSQNEVNQLKCHSLSPSKDVNHIEDHENYKCHVHSEVSRPENVNMDQNTQKFPEDSEKKSAQSSLIGIKSSKDDTSISELCTDIPRIENLVQSQDNESSSESSEKIFELTPSRRLHTKTTTVSEDQEVSSIESMKSDSDSSEEVFELIPRRHLHKRTTTVSEDREVSSIKSMKCHPKGKPASDLEVKDELDTSSCEQNVGTDSKKRDTSSSFRVLNDTSYNKKVSAQNGNNPPITKSLRISLDKLKFVTKPTPTGAKNVRLLDQNREVYAEAHSSKIKISETPNKLDKNHTKISLNRKITDYFSKIIHNPTPLEYAGQSSTQDSRDKILKREYGIFKEICVSLIDLKLQKLTPAEYHVSEIEKLINQNAKKSHDFNTDKLLNNHNQSFINSSSLPPSNNRVEKSTNTIPVSENPISDSEYLESKTIDSSQCTENEPIYNSPTKSSIPISPTKLTPSSNSEPPEVFSSDIVDLPGQQKISKKDPPLLPQCKHVSVLLTNYTTGSQATTSVSKSLNTLNTRRTRSKGKLENCRNLDTDNKKPSTIKISATDNNNELTVTRQNESDVVACTDTVECLGTDHLSNESTVKDVTVFDNQLKPNPCVSTTMKTPTKSGISPPLKRQSPRFHHVIFDGGQTNNNADANENTVSDGPIPPEASCMRIKSPVKMNNVLPDAKRVARKFPVNGMTILSREIVETSSWVGLDDIANNVNISGMTNENTVHDAEYSKLVASDRFSNGNEMVPCNVKENELVDSPLDVNNKDNKCPAEPKNKSLLLGKKLDARTPSLSPQCTTPVNEESSSSRVTLMTTCDTAQTETNDLQDNESALYKLSSSSVPACKIVSSVGDSADTVSVACANEASVTSCLSDENLTDSPDELALQIDTDESDSEPVPVEDTYKDASLLNSSSLRKSSQDNKAIGTRKCIFCWKLFTNNAKFRKHLASHMKDTCHICDKPLTKITAVEHYTEHYGSLQIDDLMPYCDICDRWFVKKSGFEYHYKTKHQPKLRKMTPESSSIERCTICSRTYRSKEDLFMHVLTHTDHELQDAYQVAKAQQQQTTEVECHDQSNNSGKKKTEDTEQIGLESVEAIDTTRTSCRLAPNCEISICTCHKDERLEVTGGVIIEVALTCEHCKTFFKSKACFTDHYKTRSCGWIDPAAFRTTMYCNKCGLILNSLQEMHSHIRAHVDLQLEKKPSFFCKQCNVFFFGIGPLFYEHWFSHCRDPMFLASHSSFPNNFKVKIVEPENQEPTLEKEPTESLFIAEHQCEHCKMPFQTKADLKKHYSSSCKCSNIVGSSTQSLKSPKATSQATSGVSKKSEVIFKLICSICNKDFLDKPTFDSHAREHDTVRDLLQVPEQLLSKSLDPKSEQFTCSICNIEYRTMMDYKRHLLRHEVIQEKFFCNYCSLMMDSVEEFGHHSSEHKGTLEKPVACKVIFATAKFHCKRCKIWFDDQIALDKHFQTHGNTMDPKLAKIPIIKIASPVQNKSFSSSMHLQEFGDQVKLQNPVSTHNDMAAGSSKVISNLVDASEDSTSTDIELIVSENSEEGKNKQEVELIATNTPIRKEKSNTQESKKSAFLRVKNLKELLPYACGLCKSEFDSQINLDSHICIREDQFVQQPNYVCKPCKNLRFDNSKDWNQHLLSHFPLKITPFLDNNWFSVLKLQNGQQIFKCNRCPELTCASLNLMQRHYVSMHSDIYKPVFQCRICNAFTTNLEMEVRQHEAFHFQQKHHSGSCVTNMLGSHSKIGNNSRPPAVRPVDANHKPQEMQRIVDSRNYQLVSIPFSTNFVDNSNLNSQHFVAVVSNSENNLSQYQQTQPLLNADNNPPQVSLLINSNNFQEKNLMPCTTNSGYYILQRGPVSDCNNVEQTGRASSVTSSTYDQTQNRLVGNSNIIQETFQNSQVNNSVNNQPQFRLDSNDSNTMQGLIQTSCNNHSVNNPSQLQRNNTSNTFQQTTQTSQVNNSVKYQPQFRLESNDSNTMQGLIQTSCNNHSVNNPSQLQLDNTSNTFQQTTQTSQFNNPVNNQPQLRLDSSNRSILRGLFQTSRNNHSVNNPSHLQLDDTCNTFQKTTQTSRFSNSVDNQPQLRPDSADSNTTQGLIQTSRNNHPVNNSSHLQLDDTLNTFQPTSQTSHVNNLVNIQPQHQLTSNSNTFHQTVQTPGRSVDNLMSVATMKNSPSTSLLEPKIRNQFKNQSSSDNMTNKMHTFQAQTPSLAYTCRICKNFECSTKQQLKEHESRHQQLKSGDSPKRFYRCKICTNILSPSEDLLRIHMETHHKNQYKKDDVSQDQLESSTTPSRCKYCTLTFSTASQLTQHVYDCHTYLDLSSQQNMTQTQLVYPFTCKLCFIGFFNEDHLRAHIRHIHPEANAQPEPNRALFKCAICGLLLLSQVTLNYHMKSHNVNLC